MKFLHKKIVTFASPVSLVSPISFVFFLLFPLAIRANGEPHTPDEEHAAAGADALDPVTILIGITIALGVGFAVWVFMQRRGDATQPPSQPKKPAPK